MGNLFANLNSCSRIKRTEQYEVINKIFKLQTKVVFFLVFYLCKNMYSQQYFSFVSADPEVLSKRKRLVKENTNISQSSKETRAFKFLTAVDLGQ